MAYENSPFIRRIFVVISMIFGSRFIKLLSFFFVVFFVAHGVALYSFLYWKVSWLDIIMHLLGGALVAATVVWWVYFSGRISLPSLSPFFTLMLILGAVALVGVFWEFFEFLVDKFITKKNYIDLLQPGVIDTMKDLFMDILGGLAVGLLFLYERKK